MPTRKPKNPVPPVASPPIATPRLRIGRLAHARDVRLELLKVYRATRHGQVPSQDGMRMALMLQIALDMLEGEALAGTVAELEAARAREQRG